MTHNPSLRQVLENFFRHELARKGFRGTDVVPAFRAFLRSIGCPLSHGAPVHAHVYYGALQKKIARELRDRVEAEFGGLCRVGPLSPPRGPHLKANFEINFEPELRERLVPWLERNRMSLSVLVHEVRGDDARDHSEHARWLGPKLELDFSAFAPAGLG
jgi:DOPA 4,5-dioxygenase